MPRRVRRMTQYVWFFVHHNPYSLCSSGTASSTVVATGEPQGLASTRQ
jgi:hypothetical protein